MQPNKESRSADPYLTWQDLLEQDLLDGETENEGTPTDAAENAAPLQAAAGAAEAWSASAPVNLPPDVAALLAEKERLEDELKRLTGLGEPRPEDERVKRMYPVKVHTKESRIEDRRLRQHDEHQRMLKQRALEAKLAQEREEQRQAELAAESRRKAIERALARVRAQLRQAELEAERRRKAIERTLAQERAQLRQAELEAERRRKAIERSQAVLRQERHEAEHTAERQRKELEQELVQERWASDRQKALLSGAQERRQAMLWQEEVLNKQRAHALEVARARKAQQQDDLFPHRARQAREDMGEVQRTARFEPQPAGLRNIADGRQGPSANVRLDALQRLYQKNREALVWEQDRERQRENALQRRREEQSLADRLERRGKQTDRYAATG